MKLWKNKVTFAKEFFGFGFISITNCDSQWNIYNKKRMNNVHAGTCYPVASVKRCGKVNLSIIPEKDWKSI